MADNDLTKLLSEVRVPEKSHVDMLKRRSMGTSQWFLERDVHTHAIYNNNHLEFFICGQEGFKNIQKDILAAKYSIDLVLWGFDPGMELIRDPQLRRWPRGTPYGDLLTLKARQGVSVKMLIWYGGNGKEMLGDNIPDLGMVSPIPPFWGRRDNSFVAPDTSTMSNEETLQARQQYSREWLTLAIRGQFKNLEIRFRDAHYEAIEINAKKYLPSLLNSFTEAEGAKFLGTHHQKPILIDYGAEKDGNTCAYVMGLNSVTDYWDTNEHRYNDSKREIHPSGALSPFIPGGRIWHMKPYRDYAVRITGEALYSVNHNFVEGWDDADGYMYGHGSSLKMNILRKLGLHSDAFATEGRDDLRMERCLTSASDLRVEAGARSRVQILRTFPDKAEATILKAYTLASSNAINYIYIENQYVQLTEWPRLINATRKDYINGMKDGGATPSQIKPLHIFIVMPQPERDQMVPNTYDTLATLGAGGQMKSYDSSVQGVQKNAESSIAKGPQYTPMSKFGAPLLNVPSGSGSLLQSAENAPINPQKELSDNSVNVLVAMLMTYDIRGEAKDIRYKGKRDNAQQDTVAEQEEEKNRKARTHAGQADDVDLSMSNAEKDYREYNRIPHTYREIYIHSKLMMVDDTFFTVGSANLNPRSMVGDSEFNMCTDDQIFTQAARRRVWANLAGDDLNGGMGTQDEVGLTHKKWKARMSVNSANRTGGLKPENGSFIHNFEDARKDPGFRFA